MILIPSRTRLLGQYTSLVVLVAAGLLLLGYRPTVRWGGDGAAIAMAAGCAVALVASAAGAALALRSRPGSPEQALKRGFAVMGLRVGAAVTLGAGLALSGLFDPRPLLLWLAIGHAALMIPDTYLSLKVLAPEGPAKR